MLKGKTKKVEHGILFTIITIAKSYFITHFFVFCSYILDLSKIVFLFSSFSVAIGCQMDLIGDYFF